MAVLAALFDHGYTSQLEWLSAANAIAGQTYQALREIHKGAGMVLHDGVVHIGVNEFLTTFARMKRDGSFEIFWNPSPLKVVKEILKASSHIMSSDVGIVTTAKEIVRRMENIYDH